MESWTLTPKDWAIVCDYYLAQNSTLIETESHVIFHGNGPPFTPPGWNNPHNPHYPVPEPSLILFLGLFYIFLIHRRRARLN